MCPRSAEQSREWIGQQVHIHRVDRPVPHLIGGVRVQRRCSIYGRLDTPGRSECSHDRRIKYGPLTTAFSPPY